jgi:hypothetical protein
MSRFDESGRVTTPSQTSQRTHHYILKPSLHPHGWKITVRDGSGTLLYEVLRHPTTPIQYKLHSGKKPESTPLTIKSAYIGHVLRYTLIKGDDALLSIHLVVNPPSVRLQNEQRQTIARFSIISQEIVIIRTPTASVARLKFKKKPAPLNFQVNCTAEEGLQWLFAIILYTVACIEAEDATPLPELDELHEEEEVESDTL